MGNGGRGVWEQPAALQQLLCQSRGFGVSSQKFSSPQVGLESAGRRKTAAVSYSQPPLAGFNQVSPEGSQQTFPGFLMCFSICWDERLVSVLHTAFQTWDRTSWVWNIVLIFFNNSLRSFIFLGTCLLIILCALMCITRESQGSSCSWLGGPYPCTWETQGFPKM